MKQKYKVSQPYVLGTNATKWVVGKGKIMATLRVRIENGFFVGTNGCYVSLLEPTHVIANGWELLINEDGTIHCDAVRRYSDGEHSMRYIIRPNGFAKLTLKVPYDKVKTLRKGFVTPKGTKLSDGVLGLAGGHVDERYAYFRDGSFQKFLEEHGLSAVKHEDPNQTFSIRNARYGGGECHSYLFTDGKAVEESLDLGRSKSWEESCPGTCAYEGNRDLKVTGATWAIHKQTQHEGDRHNCFSILYSLEKDLTKLVGIPSEKKKEDKISQLSKIGSKGFLSLEELAKSLYEIEPNLKAEKSCKEPDKIFAYWADWNSVQINDGNKIDFPSKERAQEAYEFLQKKSFKNVAELESYLKGNGFEDAEVTRYYAYVSSNYEKTEVYIELRTSTSRANGFNRFSPCFWMGKI